MPSHRRLWLYVPRGIQNARCVRSVLTRTNTAPWRRVVRARGRRLGAGLFSKLTAAKKAALTLKSHGAAALHALPGLVRADGAGGGDEGLV